MNEVRDDFRDLVKEHKTNINHFVPAAAKHLTEKDFASRSGPVKTLVPPNLPTLQNRIRYCLRGDTMSAFAKNWVLLPIPFTSGVAESEPRASI